MPGVGRYEQDGALSSCRQFRPLGLRRRPVRTGDIDARVAIPRAFPQVSDSSIGGKLAEPGTGVMRALAATLSHLCRSQSFSVLLQKLNDSIGKVDCLAHAEPKMSNPRRISATCPVATQARSVFPCFLEQSRSAPERGAPSRQYPPFSRAAGRSSSPCKVIQRLHRAWPTGLRERLRHVRDRGAGKASA